jgi:hypothetical protein
MFETENFFKVDTCPKPILQKPKQDKVQIIVYSNPEISLELRSNEIASYSIHSSVSYLFLSSVYLMIHETDSYVMQLTSISVISGVRIYHVMHIFSL